MDKKDAITLYEKLYFHEIDAREKLNARLQTPLTLIVSFVGVLAFMLQNYEHLGFSTAAIVFLLLLGLATTALAFATFFFIRSWYNNTYSFVPAAIETELYRETLKKTYAQYEDGEQLAAEHFSDYLMNYYVQASSENTKCNDRRSIYLHKTSGALIATAAVAFLAFIAFYLGGLDKSKINKATEVSIISPVTINGGHMADTPSKPAPPPPPPPPPMRQIREGVEVVPPPPTSNQSGGKKDGK